MTLKTPKPAPIKIGAVTYTYLLNFKAVCGIEEGLNTTLGSAITELQSGVNIRYLLAFMVNGLSRPDGAIVTPAEAGTIVDTIGMEQAAKLVATGVQRFFAGGTVDAG